MLNSLSLEILFYLVKCSNTCSLNIFLVANYICKNVLRKNTVFFISSIHISWYATEITHILELYIDLYFLNRKPFELNEIFSSNIILCKWTLLFIKRGLWQLYVYDRLHSYDYMLDEHGQSKFWFSFVLVVTMLL